MESHNISLSNILLENVDENIPMSVNLTTPTKDIETGSKSLVTNPLETELIAVKSFVLKQFYLIKKLIPDIKERN